MADFISQLDGYEMDDALAQVNARTPEAWATGTRGGVPVGAGDETYNNNAKYWAERAKSAVPVGTESAVLWSEEQQLAESDKARARNNIGAEQEGAVRDVQIGGVSVVTDKVANITTPFIGTVAGGKNLLNPRWLLNGSVDGETGKPIYAEAYVITEFIEIKPNTSYTQWTEISAPYVYVYFYDSNFTYMSNRGGTNRQAYTFTTPSTAKYVRLLFGGTANPHQVSNGYKYQLEEGITATPYEPYFESNLQLTRKQNIVNLANAILDTITYGGTLTVTKNSNATYTVNGTTNSSLTPVIARPVLKKGTYKLCGCPLGLDDCKLFVMDSNNNIFAEDFGNGAVFTLNADTSCVLLFKFGGGSSLNNTLFKPMITTNLDATYDDFIEYGHYGSVTSAVVGTTGLKIFRNGNVIGIYMNNASSNASSIIGTLPSDLATSDALILPYCGFVGSGATPIELYIAGGKNSAHGIYVRNGSTHSNLSSATGIYGYAMFVID